LNVDVMDRKPWNKKELSFIEDNFGKVSSYEIAVALGRTESSVLNKARRLRLIHDRWWTEEEDAYLKENYGKISKKQIAANLKRTISAVSSRAIKIGVARVFTYPPEKFCCDCGGKIANKYVEVARCRSCQYKHNAGENHFWWNGGVTPLYRMVQRDLWKVWRFPVLERDKFECQVCGYHGKDLEVHHKRRYVEIRDYVLGQNPHLSIKVFSERAELAKKIIKEHNMSDGVTLCKECHRKIHTEKSGELLETPNGNAEGNQQPSPPKLKVIVGGTVQRLTGEESATDNPDTSAGHIKQKM